MEKSKPGNAIRKQKQRIDRGKLKDFIRTYLESGQCTTFQLEGVLTEDSSLWQEEFFDKFLGTDALRQYYLSSEDNRNFLNALFRSAFMYGGAYFMSSLESVLVEKTGN